MTSGYTRLWALIDREFVTLTRRWTALFLGCAFVLGTLALAWIASPRTYVTLALALSTPMQVGVPTLAFALSYDAVTDDRARGELAVVQTMRVPRWLYVSGVAAGRGLAVVLVVFVALLLAALVVALVPHSHSFIATHGSLDSPVLYGRFAAVTILYATVVVTVATLLSVVVTRGRALAAAVTALLAIVGGVDLLVALGVTSHLLTGSLLDSVVAFDPVSAYRALAFDVLPPTLTAGRPTHAGWLPVVGLGCWLCLAFAVAAVTVWTPLEVRHGGDAQ